MNSVAIIQARTNSSRLPGKVLLPVGGIPLVVLAARRAANTGRQVIVATSNEETDDTLAALLAKEGIIYYRGSLCNPLQRIVRALDGYSDDTLVFRLTADNVFPDGSLLDEIEEEFVFHNHNYLCCNGENSGLPYGMSAELTRLKYLREALEFSISQYEREHVTPYIRKKYGEKYFARYSHWAKGHLRCTVDCLDDYLAVQHVFSSINFPEIAPAFELVNLLSDAPFQARKSGKVKKLVLGTAQLGLVYGVANKSGQPDQSTADALIKTAIVNGAAFIDTARGYGNSEEVIGNTLSSGWEGRVKIITKLSPLSECPVNATSEVVRAFVDASLYRSCLALRSSIIDVLLLHRASHLWEWSSNVWERLLEHREDGRLKYLGVSVQSPKELEIALKVPEVEYIQMPFNLLDWRWDELIPIIKEVKQKRNLFIHTRSALLQGLLTSTDSEHWQRANIENPEKIIKWLREQAAIYGANNIADFCLSYVKSLDWIDGVVVGMENVSQLSSNINIFSTKNIALNNFDEILESRPLLLEENLNPVFWRKNDE